MSRALVGAAAMVALLGAPAAEAAQHIDGNAHQWWTVAAPSYNIDQRFTFRAMSDATYFALVVWYDHGAPSDGAYMGVQQLAGGARIARFSVWNSTAATAAAGGTCRNFDGEGIGKTCEIPFAFQLDHPYRYRMWRLSNDGQGNWWGAWIIDEVTHVETPIGQIRTPAVDGDVTSADTFDEYFGDAMPCDRVPWSAADILAPTLNATTSTATPAAPTFGACSGGRLSPATGGALRLELGANNAVPTLPPDAGPGPGPGAAGDAGTGGGGTAPGGCAATRPGGASWLAWVVGLVACAAHPARRRR